MQYPTVPANNILGIVALKQMLNPIKDNANVIKGKDIWIVKFSQYIGTWLKSLRKLKAMTAMEQITARIQK